ncbi:MAG: lipoate--protein ligase family protein [Chloroflexi bacterium]|nr:lipoate--protein ligase family protein [Chloroflexota bacterium]
MPPPIRLLSLGTTHWLNTQAVYHALAETMTAESPDTIIFAQPLQPYLCIGYHQELDSVLDRQACARMSLPIVRRRVGGGATYLDVNQLFYQCIFHHTRLPAIITDVYARLLAAPVATLKSLGLNAELRDENEIEVGRDPSGRPDGKRIAGIGGGRIGESAVVVGNILFDFDYNVMTRAWRAPSESFRRLASQSLRERVTTLWSELALPVSPEEVQRMMIEEFAYALKRPLEPGNLTPVEEEKIKEVGKRLKSYNWLAMHQNGAKPMKSLKISRGVFIRAEELTVGEYQLRATFRVRDDVIEHAVLESEPERDWGETTTNLTGIKVKDWRETLKML